MIGGRSVVRVGATRGRRLHAVHWLCLPCPHGAAQRHHPRSRAGLVRSKAQSIVGECQTNLYPIMMSDFSCKKCQNKVEF